MSYQYFNYDKWIKSGKQNGLVNVHSPEEAAAISKTPRLPQDHPFKLSTLDLFHSWESPYYKAEMLIQVTKDLGKQAAALDRRQKNYKSEFSI